MKYGPDLILQEELRLIALHIICPFHDMQVEIPKGFNKLKSRLDEIIHQIDHKRIIGFYPQSSDDPPDENICHYYLGIEVTNQDDVPEQLIKITIPSGKFVSYKYKGTLDKWHEAYDIVNTFIGKENLKNNLACHILEVKNINNDLDDKGKVDNEIELMIPVISN